MTSSFSEITFKSSASVSTTFSPSSVLTVSLSVVIVVGFAALIVWNSPYLGWDYSHPETAVAGVMIHAFEWLYVRIAPFEIVCLTTCSLTASSSCESPLDFLIVLMAPFVPIGAFVLSVGGTVALAYYLSWRRMRGMDLAEVLRDDTMM